MKPSKFQLEEAPPEEPGMLMTSMIDVIFILLAFFICVSEIKKSRLDVDVPEVPQIEAPAALNTAPVAVEITADNRVFVDGQLADTDARLMFLLKKILREHGATVPVHLSADKKAPYGIVARVVSQLSQAGITNIALPVEAGG